MEVPKPFINQTEEEKGDYVSYLFDHIMYATEEIKRAEKDYFHREEDIKNAWEYLELSKDTPLSVSKIIQVGNLVSESNPYISRGYRQIGEVLIDTQTPIASPKEISSKMEFLVENYLEDFDREDTFERESNFFLQMIRIHPFEDGNRRTAFLLVNHQLLEEGYAPVYLTEDIYDTYLSCIKENDASKMAELFRQQSIKEANRILEEKEHSTRRR